MDAIQILEKVNSFYSNSFNQLIIITIAILGFGGVILPIIMQFYQSRIYKAEQKSIQSFIASELAKGLEELKKEYTNLFEIEKNKIQDQLKENKSAIEEYINKEIANANAGVYFVQGTTTVSTKRFSSAIRCYADAAELFLKGGDERNALLALDNMMKCMPELNKENYEEDLAINKSISTLLERMESKDTTGRYTDYMIKIRTEFEKAKKKELLTNKPA
jgi:hypothetical protein